jgi:predicted nuclease of predicted toxin-antitoxin system
MKVLLDENLPHDLRHLLVGHEVFTTAFMGWKGLENGDLLAEAAKSGFHAVVTMDSGIEYQHNPQTLPASVIILRAATNKLDDLRFLVPGLLAVLLELEPGMVYRVPA